MGIVTAWFSKFRTIKRVTLISIITITASPPFKTFTPLSVLSSRQNNGIFLVFLSQKSEFDRDNLLEISQPASWENEKKILKMSSVFFFFFLFCFFVVVLFFYEEC